MADPRTRVAVLSALPLHRDVLVRALAPRLPSIHLIASDGPVEADILLVDVELPGGEALIASAGVPVVLWGGYLHASRVEEMRARGVSYYVSALATPDQVAGAVVRAAREPYQRRVWATFRFGRPSSASTCFSPSIWGASSGVVSDPIVVGTPGRGSVTYGITGWRGVAA